MDLKKMIAEIPDFPKPGISFKDITPLMADGVAFSYACQQLVDFAKQVQAEVILGPEARGFIFGCPVASALKLGFVPIRKQGKLPRETISSYSQSEYDNNLLYVHADSIKKGQRVLIVDDLLATGGTIAAGCKLAESLGGVIVGLAFLIELTELDGRDKLAKYPIFSLIKY